MSDLRVAVLTCSDSCADGTAEDESGRAIIDACEDLGWLVVAYHVCADEMECVSTSLLEMADMESADIVLTLGGTGLGPRDITPEATERIIERAVPGIAEAVREASRGTNSPCLMSRATAGMRGQSLIINLPGGVAPTLAAFERIAPHLTTAVGMMHDDDRD